MLWRLRLTIVVMEKQQYLPFVICLPRRISQQYKPFHVAMERQQYLPFVTCLTTRSSK